MGGGAKPLPPTRGDWGEQSSPQRESCGARWGRFAEQIGDRERETLTSKLVFEQRKGGYAACSKLEAGALLLACEAIWGFGGEAPNSILRSKITFPKENNNCK